MVDEPAPSTPVARAPDGPRTPWLEARDPWRAQAGLDAASAGAAVAASLGALLLVAAAAGVLVVAVLLELGAWRFGRGDPLWTAVLAVLAATGWTWLLLAWLRVAGRFASHGLLRLAPLGAEEEEARRAPAASWAGGDPARHGPAEVAAACAFVPPLALALLLPLLLAELGGWPGTITTFDVAIGGAIAASLAAAGLVVPVGGCALALGAGLPPLAALAAVLRGVARGRASLGAFFAVQALQVAAVAGSGLFVCGLTWVALPWLAVAGLAGQVALALGWTGAEAATGAPPARFTSRPADPPAWLLATASGCVRLALGATLAAGSLAAAAGDSTLPGGVFAAVAAVIAVPWLLGVALLRHELAHHRAVVLDDDGLRLDVGPSWSGTRVPWDRVRGARVREDGVVLTLRWSQLLVRVEAAQIDPLLQWLETRGVRRTDAA